MLSGNIPVALITALFFGIHPMHVESVAWVSERKDVLYALFYLAAMVFYVRYLNSGRRRGYLCLTFSLFFLSCLSKPMAVSLPLVLLCIDYFVSGRIRKKI